MTRMKYLVAALLLAHLAVPAQLLQALGLDAIGDRLGRQKARLFFTHSRLQMRRKQKMLQFKTKRKHRRRQSEKQTKNVTTTQAQSNR